MTFYSDSQETISRFGNLIDELQDFFRTSAVPYGEPGDFFAFARRLRKDTQLRANLSILTKSIMERESEISLRIFITILAIASGGPDIATSERDVSMPFNVITDFLISVGSCSQIGAEHPDSPCSPSTIDPAAIDPAVTDPAVIDSAARSVAHDQAYDHPFLEAQSSSFATAAIRDEEEGEELVPRVHL